ncbi:uncharacterized protein MELLADRAFT_68436 [Melampsora larici-populina 98AG31]|uniref:Uncharacterized protein n=1 Tax=Melampsora larici-populina (strain 98AG31 / pathotype 3-4-7) TaxID=747676 RepID=F4S6T8_MELLP|nr:uncharacterized protein MELLADRAFT_68436 [Melampsora larici-populina 98AG31]EGF99630.1 hypothetical protein MELLADRAFT_68436 [Melampsora larici-populina 98AG31]
MQSVILTQSTLSKTLEAIVKTQKEFENRLQLGQERLDQECSIVKYQSDVESVILTQSTFSKTLEAILKTQQELENRLQLGQERLAQSHQQMTHQQKTFDTRIISLEKFYNISNLPRRLEASDSTSAITISPSNTPQLTGSTLDLPDPNSMQVINESDSRPLTLNDPDSSLTRLIERPIIATPAALTPDVSAVDSMDIDNQSDSSSRTQVPLCRGRDGSQASVIAGSSSWVHQTANMERGNTTPNQRNTNAFSEARLSNTRLPSTPNRRSTPVNAAFTPVDQNIRINPRSKPKLWVRPSRSSGNKLKSSLRQERDEMDPETKDDDYNMSRATQKHFRYLLGTSREKHSFPRSPTREDLEALPDLPDGTAPLGLSAPYILKPSELSQQWEHDDEMGEGFRNRCEQRLRQYGLPYVGLSSVRNDPKAEEWNRRTLEYCLDTFNCALDGLEYEDIFRLDHAELDVNRIRDLMATHIRYHINNKRIFLKDDSNLKKHMQEDRRAKRAMNLAERRHEACQTYEDLNAYQDLFLDRWYCSSDESDDEVLEEDRMRDIPIWRSRVGTALVEYIDAAYRQIRQDEVPKRPGRKPGKRKTSTTAPVVGSSKWPVGLPSDCYDSAWVASLRPKDRKALKMKPAALQDVPELLD